MLWRDLLDTTLECRDKFTAYRDRVGKRQEKGKTVVVYASYEDPSKPGIVHNRIVRADTYLEANSPGGSNEQRLSRAIVIFLFTYWEDEIRPRLAAAKSIPINEIKPDIMGDLRILRHAILHAKSNIRPDEHRRLKVVGSRFPPSTLIHISYDDMHQLFVLIKQDCARLIFSWLGVKDGAISPGQLVDIHIQRVTNDL
ncbi:hypothetical protein RBH88_03205 [Aminobacterium sp. MB27-C1]|uniref:hypothetical protein n=1 Tax=Aminobacterium sp. MB27-C1 TaxID=3070661 RepID=UPI0027DC0055|nr:hypothetical protein [Aminobacterium sp. MB27-C1]WMI72121.1 hypothetical protein RBH88_03205 [Aminobacterium sp. MB27-C1]